MNSYEVTLSILQDVENSIIFARLGTIHSSNRGHFWGTETIELKIRPRKICDSSFTR
ncbi:unnamed protein product [Acanthoscelides obtectus]|uniref:Uncharacterized protein n=1 Tax=Acanthoscelides obtectus TaxID=200917 RepID=A0A9P0KI33_ACAOB|nr:unnamed protein product [Acanthoscelides obtectus]CAK1624787.1 hypothetical protein AOBTE_LOCUS2762 [Acanthoscelides obtectus]